MVARWYQKINPLLKTEVIAKEHNYHNQRNKISFIVVVPIKQHQGRFWIGLLLSRFRNHYI